MVPCGIALSYYEFKKMLAGNLPDPAQLVEERSGLTVGELGSV